ncbi:MAG TPA: hypothetical protein VHX37_02355 [Acidobacteriaceae bacterium]|jgi:hypothetical protein|nr:hypothetical protein [Acidobacteriaceae bacterium]
MSRVGTKLRGRPLAAALAAAAMAGSTAPALAQYPGHVNENQQSGTPHLRATAVLEYTGQLGKIKESRLVPIAVWDGMQYQPGSLYLAQPAPLAVVSGTQYELESAGRPQGFFNVRDAEDLAGLWIGVGSYQAPPPPPPKAPLSASNHTYEVKDFDPDKPHFAHVPPADDQNPSSASAPTAKTAPPVDPDRPILHDRPSGGSGASDSASTANAPAIDPDRPTFHRRDEAAAPPSANQPPIDPNRPLLSYTQPTEQLKLEKADALFGLPPGMNQIAGVSDSRSLDSESWAFIWSSPDDEAKMKTALEQIAAQALAPPPPTAPAKTTATAHRHTHAPAPAPLPMLTDEEFHAFNLSFGGGATMVLTARVTGDPVKYVTIVAQPDFYGKPQVLLKQVTSGNELDVFPRMRLVDAVDTIGNGRADLLFELRGQTFRQFAIYRIDGGQATRVFVTQPTAN